MAPAEIKALRQAMGWSQENLGALVGAGTMTVSRWERGENVPTPYQITLLRAFSAAPRARGTEARAHLDSKSVAVALGVLLQREA